MANPEEDRKNEIKEAAADLIRRKVSNLYDDEPGYSAEVEEIEEQPKHLTKHQKYVAELHSSGKSSTEIQKLWHEYYERP